MTTSDQPPIQGPASGALFRALLPDAIRQSYLADTLHLTLEQHGAYVALRDLIDQYGVRAVLDDEVYVCTVLRCTEEHWHDDLGPVLVPLLDVYPEEVA